MEKETINIEGSEYWVKVVGMLQQNWALIEVFHDQKTRVYFLSDTSEVFDEMEFDSLKGAINGLQRNGFNLYTNEKDLHEFLTPPKPPFKKGKHPNGPIYSSGKFWR